MRTRERFGDYLLLKKLSEDPLGEVFRAGRLGGDGVEQVLLLRVLNGSAVQGVDLEQAIEKRAPLQETLRSPNLAEGAGVGVFEGVPYIAYEYVSGKDLATLIDQAIRRSSPVPSEHALLITERLSLGLTVAYGCRLGSERAMHGFLVPELVMLSNEGENRLLGFEVSDGLRAAARRGTPLGERFGRYLSPEALSGKPSASTDDVYSLGMILLELMSGQPLPHESPDAHRNEVQRVASLGFPKIASLIQRSLLPAAERIGDVVTWHKALDQLVRESNTSSTPFHLAFYMHNLFRDEIERESAEIETEKTLDFSKEDLRKLLEPQADLDKTVVQAPPPARPPEAPSTKPAPAAPVSSATAAASRPQTPATPQPVATKAAPVPRPGTGPVARPGTGPVERLGTGPNERPGTGPNERPGTGPAPMETARAAAKPRQSAASASDARSRVPGVLIAAALILVIGGGGSAAWWWYNNRGPGAQRVAATGAALDRPTVAVIDERAADAELAGVEARAAADGQDPAAAVAEPEPSATPAAPSREELLQQIDRAVSSRTKAVEDSLRAQYDQEIEALRTELAAAEEARVEQARALAAARDAAAKKAAAQESDRQQAEEESGAAATDSASAAGTSSDEPAAVNEAEATETAPKTDAAREQPRPASQDAAPPKAAEPPVRLGQLVTAGVGVVQPRIKTPPKPVYPMVAKRLRREADVVVMVLVDEDGKVIDTRIDRPAGYGFDEAADRAARRSEFFPATKNSVRVKMWMPLKISFRSQ